MKQPREIGIRERRLIRAYCDCSWRMSPQAFYFKWSVTQEELADICRRSQSTVRRWFKQGRYHRPPTDNDLLHLALLDFFAGGVRDVTAVGARSHLSGVV